MPLFWPLQKDYDDARYNFEKARLVDEYVARNGKQPEGRVMKSIEKQAKQIAMRRSK